MKTKLLSFEVIYKQPRFLYCCASFMGHPVWRTQACSTLRVMPSFLSRAVSSLTATHTALLRIFWSTHFEYICFFQELFLGVLWSGAFWFLSDCLCDLLLCFAYIEWTCLGFRECPLIIFGENALSFCAIHDFITSTFSFPAFQTEDFLSP